ncbi:hypothetical protein QEN19_000374 [Hanseniaspora menglaensis]
MNNLKLQKDFKAQVDSSPLLAESNNSNGWMNIIKKVQDLNTGNLGDKKSPSIDHSSNFLSENTLNPSFHMKNAIQANITNMNLKQCKNCHKPFKLQDYKEHLEFCENSAEWIKSNNKNFKPDAKPTKRKNNVKNEFLNLDSDVDISKLSPYKKRKLLQQQLKAESPLKQESANFSLNDETATKKVLKPINYASLEEIDLDRQCGVPINNKPGLYCSKPLNCKTHSLPMKKQVDGRSKSYEVSLQQYQREVKLQKQQTAKAGVDDSIYSSDSKELLKEQKLQEKKEKLLKKQEERALVKRMKQEERLKLQQLKKHEKQLKQNELPGNSGTNNISDSEAMDSRLSNKINKASAQFLLRQQLKKTGKVKKYSKEEENNLVMSGLTKAFALPIDTFQFTSSKLSSRKFRFKQALYNGLSNNKTYSHLSQKEQSLQTLNVPVYGTIYGKVGLIDVNYPNERLFNENYDMKKVRMIQYHQSVQEQAKRETLQQQQKDQQQQQQLLQKQQLQQQASAQSFPTVSAPTPVSQNATPLVNSPSQKQQIPLMNNTASNSALPPISKATKQTNVTVDQLPKLEQHYKQVFLKYQTLASQQNAANEQQLLQMKQYLTKLQPVIKYLRATKAAQGQAGGNVSSSELQST